MLVSRKNFIKLLIVAVVASNFQGAQCFLPQGRAANRFRNKIVKPITPLRLPRGGSVTELKMGGAQLAAALKSGPYGILAIFAVSTVAVIPLTLYKQLYSISVGYGMSIFLAGLGLQLTFQPAMMSTGQAMTAALMFYGIRLAAYLFLREQTRKNPSPGARKEGNFVRKTTLALSVSLFYACLTTPALYLLRNLADLSSKSLLLTKAGIGLAVFGAVLEAVADLQKYIVKQSADAGSDQFLGPTDLTYRLCRHPNYLGEIVFWIGVFVAGAPSFGSNILAWLASIPGLYGIVAIMKTATARLEGQQKEKYSGQEKYDKWVKEVKAPLVPFL